MKNTKTGIIFACGALLGLTLALGLGAAEKDKPETVDPQKALWQRLKLVGYPNGGTGMFDPETGTMYIYDATFQKCYSIRRLNELGAPAVTVRSN